MNHHHDSFPKLPNYTVSDFNLPSSQPPHSDLHLNKFDQNSSLEKQVPPSPHHQSDTLHRQLKNRHVAMISVGGAIGTGLFIGTGTALMHGGPVSLVVGYAFTGFLAWALMCSLGEMISHLPIPGGHAALACRFFSPSMGFALGWVYWYLWSVCLATELAASAILISFWTTKINPALWIALFLLGVSLINLGGARVYGEMEFWFCSIKILTIISVVILGIVLDLGAVTGERIGFRYWVEPGPFVQYEGVAGAFGRFFGFFSVLITAAFSYIGIETTAMVAAEAKNPRRNLPKAIRRVLLRVLLFYVTGTLVISVLVPSNEPRLSLAVSTGAKSPFVIAIQNAGIKGLPSIINAAILSSAWSAGSSNLYVSSRTLYGLSISGHAPRFFSKITSNGLPVYCYLVGIGMGALAFMSASNGQPGKVFGYLANMTSVSGLISWSGIFITYIRFHAGTKQQKFDRTQLPYISPLGKKGAWCGLVSCMTIILFNGFGVFIRGNWSLDTFFTCYFPVVAFLALFFIHTWCTKSKLTPEKSMDLDTGSRSCVEEDEIPPKGMIQKIWQSLM